MVVLNKLVVVVVVIAFLVTVVVFFLSFQLPFLYDESVASLV